MSLIASKSELRKRYILSFIFVFAVPVLIVLWYLYIPILNLFTSEEIEKDTANSQSIRDIMDTRTAEIGNLAVQINADSRIKEFMYKTAQDIDFNYAGSSISKLLASYKAGNNFVSLIAVYFPQSACVITQDGKYGADYFFETVMGSMDAESTRRTVGGVHFNRYLPMKSISGDKLLSGPLDGNYLTYIQSIPIGDKDALATILVFIDEKSILSMLGNFTQAGQKQVAIFDTDGGVIFSQGGDPGELQALLSKRPDNGQPYFITELGGGKNTIVSYSVSKANNWTYVFTSSMDSLIEKVNAIRGKTSLVGLLCLSVGLALAMLMAVYNYKPWLYLTNKLSLYNMRPQDGRTAKNEYLLAMDAIESMHQRQEKLHSDISKSRLEVSEYLLQSLCEGKRAPSGVPDPEYFPFRDFCVVVADTDETQQSFQSYSRFIVRFVRLYVKNWAISAFEDEKGRLTLIFNTDAQDERACVQQLRDLKGLIDSRFGVLIFAGIGCFCDDIRELRKSRDEAVKSLEYCFLKSKDTSVYYPDIQKYIVSSLNLPVSSDNPLLNALKAGDAQSCTRLLDEYFSGIISTGSISMPYMYCLFYNFVSVVINACGDIHTDFSEIFHQSSEQLLNIDQYRNAKQMISCVYNIYGIMCNYIQKNKAPNNLRLREQVLACIQENFRNKGMSLIETAGRLGYSPSYLSRFINQEFGIGFGELLNRSRLSCARKLLSETNSAVGEIADLAGFGSINNFTRAFKRAEGISPKQYRDVSYSTAKKAHSAV